MNRKRILLLLVAIGLVAAATAYSMGWFHRDTTLQGSGTVEARDIRVGSKVGGRIDKIVVREGDTVKAGQVLISLTTRNWRRRSESSGGGGKSGAWLSTGRNCGSESGAGRSESGIRSTQKWLSSGRHRGGTGGSRSREGGCGAREAGL